MDPRVELVEAFLRNIHSGQPMKAEIWLTKEARTAEAFVAFGGLDSVIKQSTATADRHGGLRSVEVLSADIDGDGIFVRAKVRFNREDTSGVGVEPADQTIWEVRVVREEGRWKLDL